MTKKFQLWRRKDRGDKYYVTFAHSPGKWQSTGCTDRQEAEEWAYLHQEPGHKPSPSKITLRQFSAGFFTEDS